jgi:cytoskeletal protein RodZ
VAINPSNAPTGGNQVNRQSRSVAGLASALLIAGFVVSGCGRNGAGQPAQPTAIQSASASSVAATLGPEPPDASMPDSVSSPESTSSPAAPSPDSQETPTPATTPAPPRTTTSPAPVATSDPIAGDLPSIDDALNGIGGSLSGADPSSIGGE